MSEVSTSRDALPLSPSSPFARRKSSDFSPQYHGPRKEPDVSLVQFLINYAKDPDCPILFGAFLKEVVLRDGGGDLIHRIASYLRNTEIRDFQPSPRFWREVEPYSFFDQVHSPTTSVTTPPAAPIPEQYRPNAQLTPILTLNLEPVVEPPAIHKLSPDEDVDEEQAGVETESLGGEARQNDPEGVRTSQRSGDHVPGVPDAFSRSVPVVAPLLHSRSTVGSGKAGRFIGKHGPLFQRLQAIRSLPRTGVLHDGDEAMDQTGPDWEANSWYKDSRQPPLAARLDTVVKFLAEEDVDRCLDWEAKFEEVVAYLEWLANQDDRHQLDNASPQTQAMFNDALNKAKAHVLFQEHHYNPTPLEIAKPRTSPLRSTRLNWMVGGQAWPLPSRTSSLPDRRTLLPRSAPPRTPGPVNRMLVDRPEDDHLYEQLAQDERQWWQPIAGNDLEHIPTNAENSQERNNMAYVEDRSFHSSAHGTNTGWIRTDPAGTGRPTSLPSGRALRPGSPKSWAMERGARRAGLQQALRALPTNPTTAELHTPWRRLVLPVPAATLRQACESADGPQWTPPSLDPSQLPEQLDPLQHTVDYRDRLRTIKMSRKVALMQVDAQHAGDPRWPALPPNLVNGGPFARPVLDAKAEARRDMLRLCRTTVAMLEAAYRRVPRPLLEAVLRMVREGAKGDEARLPEGVELAGDEWEQVGRERRPRYLDHEEVMWLKFLTGEYVNSKNWERRFVPDTPRDKYRLFLLFAQKVQKLLDDANPQGLFSRHDAEVEVEDLLAAINAGKDSSAVTKYEFQPHDACCWLDRLNKSGHVRFRLDVVCYGVVERPVAEYFPEHRVIWPTAGQLERPKQLEKHITDFGTVIQGRLGQPDVGEGSPVWNFFASLAFRLGYTISALEQTPADEPAPSPTAAARRLRDALTKWKQACADLQGTASPEPTAQELASIRTKIIDELSANEPMLHPARAAHHHSISSSSGTAALVRDHNWDWAALPVRGQSARRQYWSVDRWPLGTGHLSSSAERAVRQDEHLDRAVTYDAAAQDPTTDAKYLRPKLTPYQQEKTVYRRGPAVFALGDTRLQRERIERSMADMVENAMGLQRRPKRTWGDALTNLNPFSSPSSRAEDRKGEDWLPPVDPKLVPKSWGPVAEAEQQQQQDASEELESDTDSEEEFGEDFEIQSVDVAMTGMGESWMAD